MDNRLKQPTATLDASFDIFPDLLFLVSPEGIILDYRGGRDAQLYAPPDAFLRRSMHEVLPPTVAGRLADAIARACGTQGPVTVEYTLPMPDGEHEYEARLVPLAPGALLAICRDVTEAPRTVERLATKRPLEETRLTEALSLLRSTLDSTADGILVVDRHGRIAISNETFAKMWRIPKAIVDAPDADRRMAFVLDQLADPEAFLAKVRELYASPDAESFDVLTFKDGRTFERYSQPHYQDGAIVGRVWSFRDVTARKRAEAALRQNLEAAEALTRSVVAHFNDALAVIIGSTQVVRRLAPPDPVVQDNLDAVLAATARAQALIGQVRALAQAPLAAPEQSALWGALLATRPNVLVEGPEAATDAMLRALTPHCAEPVGTWSDGLEGHRPPTLIVREVAALSAADQRRLLEWLGAGERLQVLSTTAQPLFALVEHGEFLEALYYRLNVVRLDVNGGARLQES